ncbi:MAG TPA: CHAT domain-containing protein [Roseomonas sp.]|jgi:CHAT domain-containing protein
MRPQFAAVLGILALLGGCAEPPPEAYVTRGGSQAGQPAGTDSRGDACTVQTGRQPPADNPVIRAQEAYCGGWGQPAARIIQMRGSTGAADLDRLAASGLWRSWLDQRVTCGPPVATTVAGGAQARLLSCTRRAGGWPHVALVIAGPEGPVVADGVATATPVIERLALGQQATGSTGSRSAAMELAVTRLAADAFRTGDVGRYEELMRLGADLNQTENYTAAEEAYRAALAVQERVLGRDNPNIVGALLGLAVNISNQQRPREAQVLLDRAGQLAPNAADTLAQARYLHYSGLVALNRGEPAAAIPLLERAEAAYRAHIPNEAQEDTSISGVVADPIAQSAILGLAEAMRNRALALTRGNRSGEATALVGAARGLLRRAGLEATITIGRALRTQADAEARRGRTEASARLLEQAATRFAVAVPGERPEAITLFLAGRQRLLTGRRSEALTAFRAGAAIVRARQVALPVDAVIPYLDALDAEATANPAQDQALRAEMFSAAQLAQRGSTARFVQQASARVGAAGGDTRVATAVRALQEADRALRALFNERDTATGGGNAELDNRINAAQQRRNEAESEVAAAAPGYRQLLLTATDAQSVARVLAPEEALVTMLLGPRHGYVMAIRRGTVTAVRTALGETEAGERVQKLRASVELNAQGQVPVFDVAQARALYDALLAPLSAATEGAATLIVAPDGPLLSLPFAMLLTGPADAAALGRAPFLIRRHAIVHVPSPQALATLRAATGGSAAPLPYIGFGDFVPPTPAQLARTFPSDRCGEDARLAQGLGRLAGTRTEVQAARQLTGAAPDAVLLGADFTAAKLRQAHLGQYRILHLATHALLAGELNCLPEPTILLSTPPGAADANAAFMRASEVLNIQMDADLVILSACNTGGAGGAGGEALSGLARAFFYAGARGLLITHWAVDDGAAALTVADTLRRQQAGDSSAAALRGAQLLLLDEAGSRLPAAFSHPYYWAPFALIGDGRRSPARAASAGDASRNASVNIPPPGATATVPAGDTGGTSRL